MSEIEFLKMDVRQYDSLKTIEDIDVVFHLAANANVPFSVEHPEYDFTTNVIGTFHILKTCLDSDLKKVVYTSSAAAYGEPDYLPIDEKHPLAPISPYGASKLAGELLGLAYFSTYGLPFTVVRIFNSYGERQRRYVMYDLVKKLGFNPEVLEVLGTGEETRAFCYIKDTVDAILLVAEKQSSIGETYNVGGETPLRIQELVELILEQLELKGKTKVYYTGKSWKGDIRNLNPDISKIKKLGFEPQTSLKIGLANLISWIHSLA